MDNKDRELLELAAKAVGLCIYDYDKSNHQCWLMPYGQVAWNPLADDGDALRLAVKLRLGIEHVEQALVKGCAAVIGKDGRYILGEKHEADPYAATRRAIVRAAAEIGRSMP